MISSEEAFALLSIWKQRGSHLRAIAVFCEIAFAEVLTVLEVRDDSKEAVFRVSGDSAPKTFDLSGASFEYGTNIGGFSDETMRLFAGHIMRIRLPNGDIFVLGELPN